MGAPLGLGDTVCFATVEGTVYVTGLDGTALRTAKLGDTCHSSPVLGAGLLIVGCDDGSLYGDVSRDKLRHHVRIAGANCLGVLFDKAK